MPIRNPSPLRFGYRLNAGDMLISLHRLLCAVLAIDAIEIRTKANADDPLGRLQGECFEDEVTHLLVSTAAFNRVYRMQQHPRRVANKITTDPVDGTCGTLFPDSRGSPVSEPLSFKDACDKILHAEVIITERSTKTFKLSGVFPRKRRWHADLDLVEYVRLSTQNFNPIYYDRDWNR